MIVKAMLMEEGTFSQIDLEEGKHEKPGNLQDVRTYLDKTFIPLFDHLEVLKIHYFTSHLAVDK